MLNEQYFFVFIQVRSKPSVDGDELGVVTQEDEIFATAQQGDWIQVYLANGTGGTQVRRVLCERCTLASKKKRVDFFF